LSSIHKKKNFKRRKSCFSKRRWFWSNLI
jgi:hypothetical protein